MSEVSAGEFEKVGKREKNEKVRMLDQRRKAETQNSNKPKVKLNEYIILVHSLYLTQVVVEMRLYLHDKSNRSLQDTRRLSV